MPELGAALPKVFRRRSLNAFLRLGPAAWRAVRERVSELLRHDSPALRDNELAIRTCLLRQRDATMLRPVKPANYVDFYSSLEHADQRGAPCSGPITRCCPTGGTCPWPTTAAPTPSWCSGTAHPPAQWPVPARRARRAGLRP
ncbi:MAG: hypothetical protein WKG07_17055 [Hymenobacter sp.]